MNNKTILVVDGQGGQMGSQLIKALLSTFQNVTVLAVGTNATASAAMLKAGAHQAASGENPVAVASKMADIIIGPIGIVIADSLLGEVTPAMAVSVGQSKAVKILIPVNKCENLVAGVPDVSVSVLINDAIAKAIKVLGGEYCR